MALMLVMLAMLGLIPKPVGEIDLELGLIPIQQRDKSVMHFFRHLRSLPGPIDWSRGSRLSTVTRSQIKLSS